MFATLELPLRDDSRHKRLQGGRACHPCRIKKIKCDGKQPCMQCKARRRKCSFVKNAGDSYIRLDDSLSANGDNVNIMDTAEGEERITNSDDQLFIGQDEANIAHKEAGQQIANMHQRNGESSTRTEKMVEQLTDALTRLALNQQEDRSTNASSLPTRSSTPTPASATNPSTVTPWLSYGDLIRWTPERYPPANYSVLLDLPSRAVQEQLIGGFFSHCHHLLPTLSRRLFYDQLEMKGSLITPLLLNIMYAHASLHNPLWAYQSRSFYSRARQLVDDFMDTPRMSTVLALLYLAAYDEGTRSSRSWMYSGMALRMAMDLGLYRANYYSNEMSQFDVELRKRVLWTCYAMDQLSSSLIERPPMLSSNLISLDLPAPLPEDNDQERMAVAALSQLCRLVMILEKVIHYFLARKSSRQQTDKSWKGLVATDSDDEQQVTTFLNDIRHWHALLPHTLTWYGVDSSNDVGGTHNGNSNGISAQQHHHHSKQGQHQHWAVVNLHLLAFILELSLLLCRPYPTITERGYYLIRSTSQLVSWTLQYPHLRLSKALTAYSGLFCTSVLLLHHSPSELQSNNQWESNELTKATLRQCLMHARQCLQHIPEQDIQRFSHLVDTILSPSMNCPTDPAFGTATMDATMEAAAAAVVTATGVVGGDHDLDLLSSVSPLTDAYLGQYDSPSILQHHNQRHHHEKRQQPMAATISHGSFMTPVFEKSMDPLSHALPIPAVRPMESTSTTTATTLSFQQKQQQGAASGSSSRTSFGMTPMTTSSSSSPRAPSKQSQQYQHHHQRNQHHNHSIEPADYTFELISVADEWARSLAYDSQQMETLGNNRNH